MGGYLVCEECGGYYELQQGELPADFTDDCECGGKLKYMETLGSSDKNIKQMTSSLICPYCGTENPEDGKLCKSCKRILRMPLKSPITSTKTQSKDGIFETWNKQTNNIKALSLVGICCIGLLLIVGISGMLSPDKTTTNLPTTPTNSISSDSGTSESDYITKAQGWSHSYYDALSSLNISTNSYESGSISASEYISELKAEKSKIDTILGQEKSTTPPNKFANVHQLSISAEQDASNAIGLLITGVQSNDSGAISQAKDLMSSSTEKLNQASTELNQM